MSSVIDGKQFADDLCEKLKAEVTELEAQHQLLPCIAVVLVGEDPASQVYVRNKVRRCEQLGIRSIEHRLGDDTTEKELLALIDELNNDSAVHGILVQLPVPDQINDCLLYTSPSPRD